VLRVALELRERLVLGDELDTRDARIAGELLLEVVNLLQRRVVGDVDRDLADALTKAVEDLRERVTDEQVDAREDEDEGDRQHRGKAHGEISPEALPGAIERELEVSQHHRGTCLSVRLARSAPRRSR